MNATQFPTSYAQAEAMLQEREANTGYKVVNLLIGTDLFRVGDDIIIRDQNEEGAGRCSMVRFKPDGSIQLKFGNARGKAMSGRLLRMSLAMPAGWSLLMCHSEKVSTKPRYACLKGPGEYCKRFVDSTIFHPSEAALAVAA